MRLWLALLPAGAGAADPARPAPERGPALLAPLGRAAAEVVCSRYENYMGPGFQL